MKTLTRNLPLLVQAIGALIVAFAVGCLAGVAWGVLTFGLEAVIGGALADTDDAPAQASDPTVYRGGA